MSRLVQKTALVGGLFLVAPMSVSAEKSAKGPNIGFAYKFELANNDDGLNKDADADTPTTKWRLKELRIGFSGEAGPNAFYEVEINGANTGTTNTGIIDHAEFWLKPLKGLELRIGNPKGLVYGWRQKLDGPMDYTASASAAHSPWGRAEAIQGSYNLGAGGTVTLQVARDVYDCTVDDQGVKTCVGYTKAEDSNTTAVEWVGDFGGIMPLIQYATYDTNHSSTFSLGARYKTKMLDIRLDHITDNRWRRLDATKEGEDVLTGMNLEGYVHIGDIEGFFMYSTYNKEDDVLAGAKEPEVNNPGEFNDNKQLMALGGSFKGLSKSFKPFLVYVSESGDFTDKNGKDATFTETTIKFGVKGAW